MNGKGTDKLIGPHASPSNLMFVWHQGLLRLSARFPHSKIMICFEMVVPYHDSVVAEISEYFGQAQRIEAHRFGGAVRTRDFYITPDIPTIMHQNITATYRLPGGYRWPAPGSSVHIDHPPTITTYYPKNLYNKNTQQLSNYELQTLRDLRVFHMDSGHIKYPGPVEVAHWLGLDASHIKILTQCFPCYGEVHDTSTLSIPKLLQLHQQVDRSKVSNCGDKILCMPCMDCVTILARAWHKNATKAAFITMLNSFLKHPDKSQANTLKLSKTLPHTCTANCEHATKLCDFEQTHGRTRRMS